VERRSGDGTIVTPEAVRLDFEAANVGSRFVALGIDLLLQGSTVFLLVLASSLVVAGAGLGVPDWVGVTLVLLLIFAVFWGYPVVMETAWRGRTLGKAAMGLRVVTVEGAPIGFRHAAVRAALTIVDFYATSGVAALLSALLTPRHQRLGDLVAGTLVVRERTGAGAPAAVRFAIPPGAEAYAGTLDVSGLRAGDYATVRSFLLRAPQLAPRVRADLAARVAAPLADRMRHSPPPGVTPEVFLTCVAARYQRRGEGPGWTAATVPAGPGRPGAPPASGDAGFVPPT